MSLLTFETVCNEKNILWQVIFVKLISFLLNMTIMFQKTAFFGNFWLILKNKFFLYDKLHSFLCESCVFILVYAFSCMPAVQM